MIRFDKYQQHELVEGLVVAIKLFAVTCSFLGGCIVMGLIAVAVFI